MIQIKTLLLLSLLLATASATAYTQADTEQAEQMTQEMLERIAWEEGEHAEGLNGVVQFVFNDVSMALLSDANFDRMRIVAPIIERADMTQRQINAVLEANYQTTLDARYASNNGVLFAAYIHPISSLSEEQVRSGMRQVAALVQNFGGSYSSDEMIYIQQDNE